MYSFLFSFVTSMFRPSGFRSIVWTSPKLSSSVEKVGSMTPVISFSLHAYQSFGTVRRRVFVQCPCQCSVEVCIYPLHICKRHPLPQDHFIESTDKESVEEPSMEDGKPNHSSNEFEIIQMLGVDA